MPWLIAQLAPRTTERAAHIHRPRRRPALAPRFRCTWREIIDGLRGEYRVHPSNRAEPRLANSSPAQRRDSHHNGSRSQSLTSAKSQKKVDTAAPQLSMRTTFLFIEMSGNLLAITLGKAAMHILEFIDPGSVSGSWRLQALFDLYAWFRSTYPTPQEFCDAHKSPEEVFEWVLNYQRQHLEHIWLIILGQ